MVLWAISNAKISPSTGLRRVRSNALGSLEDRLRGNRFYEPLLRKSTKKLVFLVN